MERADHLADRQPTATHSPSAIIRKMFVISFVNDLRTLCYRRVVSSINPGVHENRTETAASLWQLVRETDR